MNTREELCDILMFELPDPNPWEGEIRLLIDRLVANGVTVQKHGRGEEDVTDINVGNKWISVEEDMPKKRGHYFIAYKFDGSDMRFYGEAMFHPEGGNGLVDRPHFSNEGVGGMYVTHWMKIPELPLPEPPKEDAE